MNAANMGVFWEAFLRERTVATQIVAGDGTAVSPSNVIMAAGQKIDMRPTQRITDDSWYQFLTAVRKKPIFQQEREALFEVQATWETSDHTRDTGEEYIQWKSRGGYGVSVPYACIKRNN